jgi:hypothetical protein
VQYVERNGQHIARCSLEVVIKRLKPFAWRKREVKGSQLKNTIVNLRN